MSFDEWTPAPPPVPPPPSDGLPPANSWNPAPGCSTPPTAPSIAAGVIITGVPAQIGAMFGGAYVWSITLNDGASPANFTIDRYDASGALIDHPLELSGANGAATFNDPVNMPAATAASLQITTGPLSVPSVSQLVIPGGLPGEYLGSANPNGMVTWFQLPIPSDAPADGQIYARQNATWTPISTESGDFLPLAGGTMSGGIYFNSTGTGVAQRFLASTTMGSLRWALNLGDASTETGANAGSNFTIQSYNDAGAPTGFPFTINRATGQTTLTVGSGVSPLALNGPAGAWRSISGQTNGSMRWQMYLGNPTGELGSNFGSNFQLTSYSDAGTALATPLQINRASGVAAFSALPSFPGGSAGQVLATDGAGNLAWAPPGVPEAPTDGQQYARSNAAWTPFVSGPPTTIADTPPANPQVGQLWWDSVGGQLYVFYLDGSSSQWVAASNAASQLPPATTTTLGGVKVDGTSIKAATDGTISTVLVPMNDNRIINGDMRIDQRNGGASGQAFGYTVDRWQYYASVADIFSWQRTSSIQPNFPYQFGLSVGTTYATLGAGDYFIVQQFIEADQIGDFAWGTANAKTVTLSFWAYSSVGGTFGAALQNYAYNRSYPFTYSLPAGSIWTKIVVTIPGDTGGSWVMSGNGGSLIVSFSLGMGSTRNGPANVWSTGNYLSVAGAVNVAATAGAGWGITGVKLEIGSVATPFNRQSLAKSMADCQRYYLNIGGTPLFIGAYLNASGLNTYQAWQAPVTMRAVPTIVGAWINGQNASASGISASNDCRTISGYVVSAGAGIVSAQMNLTSLSAEL